MGIFKMVAGKLVEVSAEELAKKTAKGTAKKEAASDSAPGGHGQRRAVRSTDRVRRPNDVSRRSSLARGIAVRRGGAKHLEAD